MSPLERFFLAAGIIGVVAFIMATTPFLQTIFGQPKIGFAFDHDDTGDEGRLIKIYLMNIPINNWILKALRVSRLPAQDVYLAIQVFNASTKAIILESFVPEIALYPSNKAGRVSLPSSHLMASVSLAKWQRSTNSAVLFGNHDIPLEEGTYGVIIGFGVDDKVGAGKPMFFNVGKIESEMMWDKDITDKLWM